MIRIDWQGHASLFHRDDEKRTAISSGVLHALVSIALTMPDLASLVIRTDDGQMFCGREIADVGMLADRPNKE